MQCSRFKENRRHLCREDASIRVSHVSAQVVQDAPRHACIRCIAGRAEGVQIRLGELPIVIEHLQAQQTQRREKQSGRNPLSLTFCAISRLHRVVGVEHLGLQHC